MAETMDAYASLVEQGKVRAIGASNFSVDRIDEALRLSGQMGCPKYQSLQPLYNLYDRSDYEAKLERFCLVNRLGVIPYFSLARGFLTGKYRREQDLSKSVRGQGVKKYLNERGFRILHALDQAAGEYDSTPASVALAWLIARPGVTAPIASATNTEQLTALIEGTKLELAPSSIDLLNAASA